MAWIDASVTEMARNASCKYWFVYRVFVSRNLILFRLDLGPAPKFVLNCTADEDRKANRIVTTPLAGIVRCCWQGQSPHEGICHC